MKAYPLGAQSVWEKPINYFLSILIFFYGSLLKASDPGYMNNVGLGFKILADKEHFFNPKMKFTYEVYNKKMLRSLFQIDSKYEPLPISYEQNTLNFDVFYAVYNFDLGINILKSMSTFSSSEFKKIDQKMHQFSPYLSKKIGDHKLKISFINTHIDHYYYKMLSSQSNPLKSVGLSYEFKNYQSTYTHQEVKTGYNLYNHKLEELRFYTYLIENSFVFKFSHQWASKKFTHEQNHLYEKSNHSSFKIGHLFFDAYFIEAAFYSNWLPGLNQKSIQIMLVKNFGAKEALYEL